MGALDAPGGLIFRMRIYIAGPITGMPDLNEAAFATEAARLRDLGHETFNPVEINAGREGDGWAKCMRRDLAVLATCDAVQTLPGWQRSAGARFEVETASLLELEVWHGPRAAEIAAGALR